MDDPTIAKIIIGLAGAIVLALAGQLFAFVKWIWKLPQTYVQMPVFDAFVREQRTMSDQFITRRIFDATVGSLQEQLRSIQAERKEMHMQTQTKLDVLVNSLTTIALLQQSVMRMDADIKKLQSYAEDIKHNYVDAYVKETEKLRIKVENLEGHKNA